MCKQTKSFLGSIGFLGIGVAIGLLVAPRSGADTRRELVRKGEECLDYLSDMVRPRDKPERVADTLADEAEGFVEDAGKRIEKVIDEAAS